MGATNKNYFLLRKLHQFTGVLPLGAYLVLHLFVNAYALQGASAFESKVQILETLPFLFAWEFLLIYLPLIYHSVFGIWVAFIGKNNPLRFPYARNWNFALQRWTGLFMLVFIGYHAYFMRFSGVPIGTLEGHAGYLKVVDHLSNPWIDAFYVVGVLASVFHFANGLWEFLIDWGFTVSMKAQQLSSMAMIVVWLVVSAVGLSALYSFRYPVTPISATATFNGATSQGPTTTTLAFQKEVGNGR